MDDDSGAGHGSHHHAKKTKLSVDHIPLETSINETPTVSGEGSSVDQILSTASTEVSNENAEGDIKMQDGVYEQNPTEGANSPKVRLPEENKPNNMSVEDEPKSPLVATDTVELNASASVEAGNASETNHFTERNEEQSAEAAAQENADVEAGDRNDSEPRPRNRFRGRNYRFRFDSSESGNENNGEEAADEDLEMLHDAASDDNGSDENNDDDASDDNSADTSSVDSDDSDSSLAVSVDDDDDNDSSDNGSDNNANERVDVSNLPFMQTANVRSNWNYFREIQLRSQGLSYRTEPSLGAVRYNSSQFQSRAYGSKHVVERLTMQHRLKKHGGCVNSVSFNSSGSLLVSGSDDLNINLWNWQTNKLVHSIVSGHRMNVFQTKFVEASGYRNEIEIISTGRDGQVRHMRVGPAGEVTRLVLLKQSQPTHKVALPARSQYEFLTACEDGWVRSYDLRDNVAKKVTNTKRRLYSISAHPLDNEFCVSGNDESVRVYDRRNASKPMKYHYAGHTKETKHRFTVTCAVYNNLGTEILASYSDEDVFLFDNVRHEDGKYLHRYSGHCNRKTIKGVNFFGPRSEFVVSGSDCGNIFFWDKESEIIVNWMKGDDAGVVNCLEPHPEFPIMATSGLDHDIKIWVPKGTDDEHDPPIFSRDSLKKCVRRNLNIRQTSRSFSEDRILDFLMFRQGIGGRLRHHFSSDSEDQADGDGSGEVVGGGNRRVGESGEEDEDNTMSLRCYPS
ncbi:DDB1- and CUL4-associated factor 8 isoform X2 [Topomyia yanbarensis]|uniref:DDB1- and CUL4-associated factor 8 isoform X2 n=1 Tax=Topomyia yanbarensis TaxID=2498891 RepID=UPI00273B04A8|nr:DDB1- and CUL4-associated factor 8 isoform X2 [Topomyia yanbarensis]